MGDLQAIGFAAVLVFGAALWAFRLGWAWGSAAQRAEDVADVRAALGRARDEMENRTNAGHGGF